MKNSYSVKWSMPRMNDKRSFISNHRQKEFLRKLTYNSYRFKLNPNIYFRAYMSVNCNITEKKTYLFGMSIFLCIWINNMNNGYVKTKNDVFHPLSLSFWLELKQTAIEIAQFVYEQVVCFCMCWKQWKFTFFAVCCHMILICFKL